MILPRGSGQNLIAAGSFELCQQRFLRHQHLLCLACVTEMLLTGGIRVCLYQCYKRQARLALLCFCFFSTGLVVSHKLFSENSIDGELRQHFHRSV